ELLGLSGHADRLRAAVKATKGFRHAPEDLRSPSAIGRMVKEGLIAVQRGLVLPGCEQKIGLQSARTQVVIAHELAHWNGQALRDEGQRRHRRLGMSELEGADVRGRIS